MIAYKTLNQKHPNYNELEIRKLQLLYKGGTEILDHANLFMPREALEIEQQWIARMKSAYYKNYMSEIVNSYSSEVFEKNFAVKPAEDAELIETKGDIIEKDNPFYNEFFKDADLKGNSIVNILKNALTEATVTGKAFLQTDFPKTDIKPMSLAEEEQLGSARAYVVPIPTLSVIDWHKDDITDTFDFVIIKSESATRKSLRDDRRFRTIQFKVWEKDDDGVVKYSVYELKTDKEVVDESEFSLVETGTVSFSEIPIICLECPSELCIGGLIGNSCIEHFRRYSSLIFAQNRNLFSIPVFQQGPEISSTGALSVISENDQRGTQAIRQMRSKGFAVTGPEDLIYFAEPTGSTYQLVTQQLSELVDEIHRITFTMAAATSTTQAKSALSKMMDNRAKEIVLTSFGELIKSYVIKLYSLISNARNENIEWKVLGLDEYKIALDKEMILKEAISIDLVNIPSKTFKKAHLNEVALNLLENVTPQEQLVIRSEIAEAVESGLVQLYPTDDECDCSSSSKKE